MVSTERYDLNTDNTLGGNNPSDLEAPSQKAVKEYVDNQSGGSSTDVQINGTSITNNAVANIITEGVYNASNNKIATMNDLPSPVTVDSALSTTSENPVQNKVINSALGDKLDKSGGTMTGNLIVGISSITPNGYLKGAWLQTTSATENADLTTVAVIDNNGWIYKQSKSTLLNGYQTTTNLVTSLSASSTDTQYPSAKCVYDIVGDIETALNTINSGV